MPLLRNGTHLFLIEGREPVRDALLPLLRRLHAQPAVGADGCQRRTLGDAVAAGLGEDDVRGRGEARRLGQRGAPVAEAREQPLEACQAETIRDRQRRVQPRARGVRAGCEERGVRVLLLSLKAGGVGLNLTAATRVYLLDPWWNPAVEEQAIPNPHPHPNP